jgi:hypothetical protein
MTKETNVGKKMKNFIFGLFAFVISVGAFATDQPVSIDGRNIVVTDFSEAGFGNDKLGSKDVGKGVYVFAGPSITPILSERLPNAERIIAERLKMQGVKVVDKLEDADLAIYFSTSLSLNMVKADHQAANSLAPNADQFAAVSGQLINAVLTAGPAGLVGYAAGALFNTDSKLLVQAMIFKKPYYGKSMFGKTVIKSDDVSTQAAKIFYKLEKDKEAPDDVVLKMVADQWTKHYVVFDAPAIIADAPKAPETAQATPVVQVAPAKE